MKFNFKKIPYSLKGKFCPTPHVSNETTIYATGSREKNTGRFIKKMLLKQNILDLRNLRNYKKASSGSFKVLL
jgi:hypothetical protein